MTTPMGFATKLKYIAEYTGFRMLVFIIRLFPLETASRGCGWLFLKLAPFGKRHGRALFNIERALPDLSPEERDTALDEMWDMLGRITAETVLLDRLISQPERIDFGNARPLISEIIARGNGSISVSMHAGNWELCPFPGIELGIEPASIYQTVKNPYVDRFVRKQREILSTGGIFEKGASTARTLIQFLNAGGHIGILADQRNRQGIIAPFFGLESATHTMPAQLAIKLGVPLMCIRVIRHANVTFTIEAVEIEVVATGDKSQDILEATKRINAVFEGWIRENPGQWMWGHKRWEDDAKALT